MPAYQVNFGPQIASGKIPMKWSMAHALSKPNTLAKRSMSLLRESGGWDPIPNPNDSGSGIDRRIRGVTTIVGPRSGRPASPMPSAAGYRPR